jgi:hypothetical protein
MTVSTERTDEGELLLVPPFCVGVTVPSFLFSTLFSELLCSSADVELMALMYCVNGDRGAGAEIVRPGRNDGRDKDDERGK